MDDRSWFPVKIASDREFPVMITVRPSDRRTSYLQTVGRARRGLRPGNRVWCLERARAGVVVAVAGDVAMVVWDGRHRAAVARTADLRDAQ